MTKKIQELDTRFLSSGDPNLASALGPPPYMRAEMHHHQHQHTHIHQHNPVVGASLPPIIPPTPTVKTG